MKHFHQLVLLTVLAIGALCSFGADVFPDSDRFGIYEANVYQGVVGGIPTRAAGAQLDATAYGLSTSNSAADNTAAINAALDASSWGDVILVPAGTYAWNGIVLQFGRNGRTLRGAGSGVVNFVLPNNVRAFTMGNDNDIVNTDNRDGEVTALSRGSTSITLRSGDTLYAGSRQMFRIYFKRESTTPSVFPNTRSDYERAITVVGTAQSGTTLTITQPIPYDYASSLAAGNAKIFELFQLAFLTREIGIEGINFDCTAHTTGSPTFSASISYAENCWLKDVKITSNSNFALTLDDTVNLEVTHSVFIGGSGGSSKGGVILSHNTGMLFEDSYAKGAPALYHWGNNVNCVFATSWFDGVVNANHRAWSSHNLYESNIFPFLQSDGYYGPSSADTIAYNYIRSEVLASLKRFTRYYNFIGNIAGIVGVTEVTGDDYTAKWGYPNIGNEGSTGTNVQPSIGTWWADWDVTASRPKQFSFQLTTRTDDNNGIATIQDSALGDDFESLLVASVTSYPRTRNGFNNAFLVFGTRSGDTWPVKTDVPNLGSGQPLPIQDTIENVISGPSGFQERDADVLGTAMRVANWYVVHGNQIRSGEELSGGQTIPSSYFRSAKPAYFGSKGWPAYSPFSPPSTDAAGKVAIPAGYRYINGNENYLGGGGGSSTLNATNINVGRIIRAP